MQAGKFDRRITIERFAAGSPAVDAFGGESGAWGALATVWAQRTPVSDGEKWRAQEVAAAITERFLIRWSSTVSGVSAKDRISYNSRLYDISGVKEVGRRQYIEITAAARDD